MVERLKQAIEKARQQRSAAGADASVHPPAPVASGGAWDEIPAATIDPADLARARIVTVEKEHPAHAIFDVLRTRMLIACRERGWRRIGVTSPTKGCGKSLVLLNLAFSLSRNPDLRTVVVDFDLRKPSIAASLGLGDTDGVQSLLAGTVPPARACLRLRDNLAVCAGSRAQRNSAEVLHAAGTAQTLHQLSATLSPDLLLYDLPPMLAGDDVLSFMANIDALVLVVAAGETTAGDIRACNELIEGTTNLLGVVLNKADDAEAEPYDVSYSEPVSAT